MTDEEWHVPERLYHGTTAAAARRALAEGIQPRAVTRRSNWDVFPSRPDLTYLTDAYAAFYATMAAKGNAHWGIVEVDVDALDWRRMRPEEDAMEQMTRGVKDWSQVKDTQVRSVLSKLPEGDMVARTAYVQRNADRLCGLWRVTLKRMGTCAYRGPIPPEVITRIALYDPKSNPYVTMTAIDPTITLENYHMLADRYRMLTRWFFESVTAEQWMACEFPGGEGGAGAFEMVLGPDKYKALVDARRTALAQRGGLKVLSRGVRA